MSLAPHKRQWLGKTLPACGAALVSLAALLALPSCAAHALSGELDIKTSQDPALFTRARQLSTQAQESKDPDKAIDLYRKAIAAYPDLTPAWNNLGVVLLKQNRYLEAAEAFVQATERTPTDPRPFYNLGLAWERAGYIRDALKHYERALSRDPRYLPAIRGAVHAERTLGEGREITLDWIRTALGLEQNKEWRIWFALQKPKVEELVYAKGAVGATHGPAKNPSTPSANPGK